MFFSSSFYPGCVLSWVHVFVFACLLEADVSRSVPTGRLSPAPNKPSVVHTQFNSPMGLYNPNAAREVYNEKSAGLASDAPR